MSRWWRKSLVAAVPVLLACLAAATAPAGSATSPRVSCGVSLNVVDVYFWPHGHPAVASLHFPSYSPPHVEVYRGGSVANSAQLAYLDEKGSAFTKACRAAPMSAVAFAPGAKQTIATTSKITCKLPAQAQLVTLKASNGTNLWLMLGQGTKAVFWVGMGPGGKTAAWIHGFCTAKPVPGVQ